MQKLKVVLWPEATQLPGILRWVSFHLAQLLVLKLLTPPDSGISGMHHSDTSFHAC